MKIVIIDSGLGGLSVCASLADHLVQTNQRHPVEIKYVNAVPENDWGYNQMKTRKEKVETFNRVLYGIQQWYHPKLVFVACHSLSALIDETPFAQQESLPLKGMIQMGTASILQHVSRHPASGVLIFATETTIEEAIYPTQLEAAGLETHRVVSQAFPGVATLISNDRQGQEVFQKIITFVRKALAQMAPPFEPIYAFLGCTHYGYQRALFEKAFLESGDPQTILLNPNEEASQHLIVQIPPDPNHDRLPLDLSIEFITRYALPQNEVTTLSRYLSHSPHTVKALQNYTLKPDLF